MRVPHKDVGCWWALYDYGYATVRTWPANYKHPYPGAPRRGAPHRAAARSAHAAVRNAGTNTLISAWDKLWLRLRRAT